jgi:hypothetical protein
MLLKIRITESEVNPIALTCHVDGYCRLIKTKKFFDWSFNSDEWIQTLLFANQLVKRTS